MTRALRGFLSAPWQTLGTIKMDDMRMNRNDERTVQVYRSSNRLEVEAIAQEVRAAGITCCVDGGEVALAFAGLTALDGVTLISLVVLESDAAEARDIASRWLSERPSSQQADGA